MKEQVRPQSLYLVPMYPRNRGVTSLPMSRVEQAPQYAVDRKVTQSCNPAGGAATWVSIVPLARPRSEEINIPRLGGTMTAPGITSTTRFGSRAPLS